MPQPLADRLRPKDLSEIVGQSHLTAKDALLMRAVGAARVGALVLYGPPGTGKTTLALLLAKALGMELVRLNAVNVGVKELRQAAGPSLYPKAVFVDEVHRLTRTQQDALLPHLETGLMFIGATTENPFITLSSALLSRVKVLELKPLGEDALRELADRGLAVLSHQAGTPVTLEPSAWARLLAGALGDGRRLLSALEWALPLGTAGQGRIVLGARAIEQALGKSVRHDRSGDDHYDVLSAYIKSIRGSDPDAALHYLARLIAGGEDPRTVARRLIIHAAEDVGLADPRALPMAVAAAGAVERVGLPEARIPLSEATLYLALAPKSNSALAIDAALADVEAGRHGPVPPHLRGSGYAGAGQLGRGEGYLYPHDFAGHAAAQHYLPDGVSGGYYTPSDSGEEPGLWQARPRPSGQGQKGPSKASPNPPRS